MESPVWRASAGHVGHFNNLPKDSPYYKGELFSMKSASHPGVIKFEGVFVPPFYQCLTHANDTFTSFGPFYSLAVEAARKINHTLVGDFVKSDDQTAMWGEFFNFRPDLGLFPWAPLSDAFLEVLDIPLIAVDQLVGIFEQDHILSKVKYYPINFLAMLAPFDSISLLLILFGLLFVSLYSYRLNAGNQGFKWKDLVWNLVTAWICPPQTHSQYATWRFIGLTWLLGTFFLHNLFASDMFTAMAAPAKLDVINDFVDLATKSDNTILLFAGLEQDVVTCLPQGVPDREEVTKRIEILAYENLYKDDLVRSVMEKVEAGDACHLNAKHILEQYKNQFFDGNYSDKVYISEDYGQYIPYFIPTNAHADPIIVKAFNLINKQTKESGIYNLWVKSHSKEPETLKKALLECSKGKLEHFEGLFVICGAFLAVALLVFFIELLVLLRKTCSAETTANPTEAADNDASQAVLSLLAATNDTCSSYYRRRMSILDEVWTGLESEKPSTTSNTALVAQDITESIPKSLNTQIATLSKHRMSL